MFFLSESILLDLSSHIFFLEINGVVFFIALKIGLTMHCLYSLAEPVAWKNAWWPILFVIVLKKAWCTWCNKILTNCSKFKDFNLDSPSTLINDLLKYCFDRTRHPVIYAIYNVLIFFILELLPLETIILWYLCRINFSWII